MANTTLCETCDSDIDLTHEDDYHEDESGFYHEDCYRDELEKEAAFHLGTWKKHRAEQQEKALYNDAYEWGDPKNTAYVEWLIDQADAGRG